MYIQPPAIFLIKNLQVLHVEGNYIYTYIPTYVGTYVYLDLQTAQPTYTLFIIIVIKIKI